MALLPEVVKRGLHRKKGFESIFEFAAKLGGVGKKTVEDVLRLDQKLEDRPSLKAKIETHGLGKVKAVARINEREEVQIKMVETMPKRVIEEISKIHSEPGLQIKESKFVSLNFHLDKETEFKLREFKQKLEKQRHQALTFNEVLQELLKKVEEPESKHRKPRPCKPQSRYIPAHIARKVSKKCEFPNCNKPRDVIHHPERWSLTKNHEKLQPLCKTHHQLAHSGLIQDENTWKLQTQPDKADPKFKIDQKFRQFQLC